jgi:CRISPR-associated protein Cas2
MVVMVLERVPPGVRGELTRWMLELDTGVFVGSLSALVRDRLWELTCRKMAGGAGLMVYSTNTEQGFDVRLWGATSRQPVEYEGLMLIRQPRRRRTRASQP